MENYLQDAMLRRAQMSQARQGTGNRARAMRMALYGAPTSDNPPPQETQLSAPPAAMDWDQVIAEARLRDRSRAAMAQAETLGPGMARSANAAGQGLAGLPMERLQDMAIIQALLGLR